MNNRWQRIVGFAAIGCVGFFIESVIISLAGSLFSLSPLFARLISFPCAVTTTWWLNRTKTFRSQNKVLSEIGRYLITQGAGALTNLGTFSLAIIVFPFLEAWPLVALGIGAIAGMAMNFMLASLFVFKQGKSGNE